MKFINCNNCNKNKKKILKRIKYNSKSLKLVKCKNCSLVFFSPRLSNEFYEKIYQEDLLNNSNYYTITSLEDKNDFKNRLNLALTYRPNINSVLDIGCSTGAFLEACKEKNIKNIYGVELNKESRKKSQKKKFKIYSNISKIENTYDLINISDVIEHFLNPKKELTNIRQLLNKNGLIMITTPDYNKLITKLTNIKPEEHLFYYTKKTIKYLLTKIGFDILVIENRTRFHPIKNFLYSSTFKMPLIQKIIKSILFLKIDKLIENLILKKLNNDIFVIAKKNKT